MVINNQVSLARMVAVLCAGPLIGAGNSALSQDADSDTRGVSPRGVIENIIVTAQRREQSVQDVPASISVISAASLESAGVLNTSDLAKMVPGMTMTFYGGFLQPSIRGITSTGANLGENSNVAMYVDGVYQPQQMATLMDLPDIQQIEVLKGPQGSLYGQNATGGAILITSREPTFEREGKISAGYASYDEFSLRGYISGPLSERIAGSLSAAYTERDGFRKHIVTGERDKGLDSQVVRAKLLFEPSDAASLVFTGYYSDRTDSATYAGFSINGNSIGYAPDLSGLGIPVPVPVTPVASSSRYFSADPDVFTTIESYGGSLRGAFDLDAGTLKTTTSYFENSTNYLGDADFSAVNVAMLTASPLDAHYFSQDIHFVSDNDGPINYMVGAFYLNGSEIFNHNTFSLIVPPTVPPGPKNLITASDQNARVDKEVLAAYAEVTFDVTDRLALTVGGRHTREEQRTFSDLAIVTPGAASEALPYKVEYPRGAVTFEKFTPRIVANFAVTPSSNVYASWGQGFKSGVVNTTNFTIDPVEPEVVTAYEIGYKGLLLDDALQVNLAAFYYDYEDLQSVMFVPGLAYVTQNAAEARIQGMDFELSWAATDNLTLSASGTFLDAEYRDFQDAESYIPTGIGHIPTTADLSGKPMLRSPDFSGNLSANYRIDATMGEINAFASLYYSDSYGMEPTGRIQQDAYTTLDAELSFQPEMLRGTRFVLWGKNLTDEDYLQSALVVGGLADGGTWTPPRTFGVRAEFEF